MILTASFLVLALTVPLFGGDFIKLGEVRLRHWWAIVGSLVLQVLVISVFPERLSPEMGAALHLVSYALAIAFTWFNRTIKGLALLVVGGLLNVIVIGANGGVMPARLEALQTAGIITDSVTFENSAPVEGARLWWLGDVFAIPEGLPLANVFSIGDVLLVLGGAVSIHMICESRLTRRWWDRNDATATESATSNIPCNTHDAGNASLESTVPKKTKMPANNAGLDDAPISTPPASLAAALSSRQAASTGLADLFQSDELPQDVAIDDADVVRPMVADRR